MSLAAKRIPARPLTAAYSNAPQDHTSRRHSAGREAFQILIEDQLVAHELNRDVRVPTAEDINELYNWQSGEGEHRQGGVGVQGSVRVHLILVQAGLAAGLLEAFLDLPPQPRYSGEFGEA